MRKLTVKSMLSAMAAFAAVSAVASQPATTWSVVQPPSDQPFSSTQTVAPQAGPEAPAAQVSGQGLDQVCRVARNVLQHSPQDIKVGTRAVMKPLSKTPFAIKAEALDPGKVLRGAVMRAASTVNLPVTWDFTQDSQPGFTTINANGDGYYWDWAWYNMYVDTEHPGQDDDWLITPALPLQGGYAYRVTYEVRGNADTSRGSFTDSFDAYWGDAPTVEGMSNVLIEEVSYTDQELNVKYSGIMTPQTDGDYYAGIHVTSGDNGSWVNLATISVSEGMAAAAPAAVENLTATPAAAPELKVTFDMTAPTLTNAGQTLSGPLTIKVFRNGFMVDMKDGVEPGQAVSIDDFPPYPGTYDFDVCAANAAGNGMTTYQSVSVGADITGEEVTPPVSWTFFQRPELLANFSTIDANGDGEEFYYTPFGQCLLIGQVASNDDWVVTPALNLTTENVYKAVFGLENQTDTPLSFEVCWGPEPTAESMTNVIIPLTEMQPGPWDVPVYYNGDFSVPAAGKYYVGLHLTTPTTGCFVIDNIDINSQNQKAPAECTLALRPDGTGALHLDADVKAPTVDCVGAPLAGPLTVKLLRDGMLVDSQDNLATGASVTLSDEPEKDGAHTYTVVARNAAGEGREVSAKAFVGINIPGAPSDLQACQTATTGQVRLTWAENPVDQDGYPLAPELISYDVVDVQGNVLASDVKGSECLLTIPESQYGFVAFTLKPKSRMGTGKSVTSRQTPVGPAQASPYYESFTTEGGSMHPWVNGNDANQVTWAPATKNTFTPESGITLLPGDNGLLWGQAGSYGTGVKGVLITDNIDLAGQSAPELKFQIWGYADQPSLNHLQVFAVSDGRRELLSNLDMSTLQGGWNPVTIDMSGYAGKVAHLELVTDNQIYTYSGGWSYYRTNACMIDNMSVRDPYAFNVPAAPALEVIPAEGGAGQATIKVTAPTTDISGNSLNGTLVVYVHRNGRRVASLDAVAGQKLEYVDQLPAEAMGDCGYAASAESWRGEGPMSSATAFVGTPKPAAVENVTLQETTVGSVSMTWDPVTLGEYGEAIPAGQPVTYAVYKGDNCLASGLTECKFQGKVVEDGQQEFVQLSVAASTVAGQGAPAASPMVAVGTPLTLPLAESFPNGTLTLPWAVRSKGGSVQVGTDATFTDLNSQDGDNGFLIIANNAALLSAKIDWEQGMAISFWTYAVIDNDQYDNAISVIVLCDGDEEVVSAQPIHELGTVGWHHVTVGLGAYAGKTVQLLLSASTGYYTYTILDNITTTKMADHNLTAEKITAPASVDAGQDFNVDVAVMNNGGIAAPSFSLVLYRNGQVADRMDGLSLGSGLGETYGFRQRLTPYDTENVYKAEVVYEPDMVADDNLTDELAVALKPNNLPTVAISGDATDRGNVITWDDPAVDEGGDTTESFEQAQSWAQEVDGWTIVDADGLKVGGVQGVTFPGWTTGSTTGTWKVLDSADTDVLGQYAASYASHTGDKCLCSMYAVGGANDEWLISPMLDGSAQTISMWARSYADDYGLESIELLYSTKGTAIEDFTRVGEPVEVPTGWNEISFDVPEGATHFAIRHVSNDKFFLMLDDVHFRAGRPYELRAYNLYRDQQLLKNLDRAGYTDTDCEGTHEYAVTAVYDRGESALSNAVTLDNTAVSIESLMGDSRLGDVYDLQGRLLMRQVPARAMRTLPAGIYIHDSRKVLVK